MNAIDNLNPTTTAVIFILNLGIAMFCQNPIILLCALVGALSHNFIRNGFGGAKNLLFSVTLFAVPIIVNPMVSHNGMTVLFVLNDNPVTLEATLYGISMSILLLTMLYGFRLFTQIMTSDRLLYLFEGLSPRLALVLSMGLRYVPLFSAQAKKIRMTQTALGLYKDDNIIARFRGELRVFSVLITWALENGIVTADSMTARGYGIGKRSRYTVFRFRYSDIIIIALTVILSAVTVFEIWCGALDFTYYPAIRTTEFSPSAAMGYISYGLLSFLPVFIETEDKLKWKFLQSKI